MTNGRRLDFCTQSSPWFQICFDDSVNVKHFHTILIFKPINSLDTQNPSNRDVSAPLNNSQSYKPHTPAPQKDAPCHLTSAHHSTPVTCTRKLSKTYLFKASTALLTTSSPTTNVSTLASSILSNLPTTPICGLAPFPGLNCPVPIAVQQHSV